MPVVGLGWTGGKERKGSTAHGPRERARLSLYTGQDAGARVWFAESKVELPAETPTAASTGASGSHGSSGAAPGRAVSSSTAAPSARRFEVVGPEQPCRDGAGGLAVCTTRSCSPKRIGRESDGSDSRQADYTVLKLAFMWSKVQVSEFRGHVHGIAGSLGRLKRSLEPGSPKGGRRARIRDGAKTRESIDLVSRSCCATGMVQRARCEQVEVSQLALGSEQLCEPPQCPCSSSGATQRSSRALLLVQSSVAQRALRCSLQSCAPDGRT
ncbi:hypothetical protein P4O66_017748, partial [Electrophorus voltai]